MSITVKTWNRVTEAVDALPDGCTASEIAEQAGLSVKTVRRYLKQMREQGAVRVDFRVVSDQANGRLIPQRHYSANPDMTDREFAAEMAYLEGLGGAMIEHLRPVDLQKVADNWPTPPFALVS